jgi:hypothetical protein
MSVAVYTGHQNSNLSYQVYMYFKVLHAWLDSRGPHKSSRNDVLTAHALPSKEPNLRGIRKDLATKLATRFRYGMNVDVDLPGQNRLIQGCNGVDRQAAGCKPLKIFDQEISRSKRTLCEQSVAWKPNRIKAEHESDNFTVFTGGPAVQVDLSDERAGASVDEDLVIHGLEILGECDIHATRRCDIVQGRNLLGTTDDGGDLVEVLGLGAFPLRRRCISRHKCEVDYQQGEDRKSDAHGSFSLLVWLR